MQDIVNVLMLIHKDLQELMSHLKEEAAERRTMVEETKNALTGMVTNSLLEAFSEEIEDDDDDDDDGDDIKITKA